MKHVILFGVLSVLVSVAGCAAEAPVERRVTRGLDETDRYLSKGEANGVERKVETRPAAIVGGKAVAWEELREPLAEASGGAALEELVLQRALEAECAAKGIMVSAADIARESDLLFEALRAEGASPEAESGGRMVERVRVARGLGDVRYAGLMKRTAMMRALVRDQVAINDDSVRQLYRLRYGEKYRVRLIVVPTMRDAARAIERVNAGESFAVVAAEMSTDASAGRGGVIDPISPADESYPIVIRRAASETAPGTVSAPLVLDSGFGVLRVESKIPASEPSGGMESVRTELERGVRLRQERLLMNALARRLVGGADVNVLDPGLEWSWRNRREGR
ncbi:MAG TPA: peptidylprolyl isomerase [Phycisphaerales bacterium]|nr:peptidylprolyl isomerase [Phycisphaerales bacterium]